MSRFAIVFSCLLSIMSAGSECRATLVTYPAPTGASLSSDYSVTINGQPLDIYRGFAPDGRGGNYSFAYFDFSGAVTVAVTTAKPLGNLRVLPASKGISPAVSGNTFTFSLSSPAQLSIEPDGENGPLHLFANPLEVSPPHAGDLGVTYFGPGIHNINQINMGSNTTLYIAGGAILQSTARTSLIIPTGDTVKILGRGILDGINAVGGNAMVNPTHCTNLTIDGIILKDSPTWTLCLQNCSQVTVNNLKILSTHIDAATDGIDIVNSDNVTIQDSFVRSADDNIAIMGGVNADVLSPVFNINVTRSVFWTQMANNWRIGWDSHAPYFDSFTFTDIDVIHTSRNYNWFVLVQNFNGMPLTNVRFENIRVNWESPQYNFIELMPAGASVDGLYFKDIAVTGTKGTVNLEVGVDPWGNQIGGVNNVTFENVTRFGQLTLANSPDVQVSQYATNISFIGSGGTPPPPPPPDTSSPSAPKGLRAT